MFSKKGCMQRVLCIILTNETSSLSSHFNFYFLKLTRNKGICRIKCESYYEFQYNLFPNFQLKISHSPRIMNGGAQGPGVMKKAACVHFTIQYRKGGTNKTTLPSTKPEEIEDSSSSRNRNRISTKSAEIRWRCQVQYSKQALIRKFTVKTNQTARYYDRHIKFTNSIPKCIFSLLQKNERSFTSKRH